MTWPGASSREQLATFAERLTRTRTIAPLEKTRAQVRSFSAGDRVIFWALAALVALAGATGIFALEQSLLVEVPAYGGTLNEGEVGSPRFVNPLLAITDADQDLATLTYAGLMGVSGDGTLVPVLAESYTVSEDGKTYTFKLRPNARFSDGSSVTATDVAYTVQEAQDPNLKSPEYADWSGVGVRVLDAHTVQFSLAKPYAPFLELTTLGILPSRLWQNLSAEEIPFSTLETSPVGAGPFVVASVSRDASGLISSVTLQANPRYVLGRPYLNGISFTYFAQAQDLAQALANGAIDSAYGIPNPKALTAPYARVFGVFLNPSENQVFARAEVRKALSISINRSSLVDEVLGGYATPIMGPVPPGGPVKQAAIASSPTPTEDAAQVLRNGGWMYDGTAREWKNASTKQTLSSVTIRTSNVPELKNVASYVKAAWEKLGISVDIELYEPGDLSQNVIRPRKYDALLYGMVIGRDQDLYAFWDSQEINDPGLNIALYANKTVDSLLTDARTQTNPEKRVADLQQVEDAVAADYPATFLYSPDFSYTVPENLHGVVLPQITSPSDRFATVASWYLDTDSVWPFFARHASHGTTPANTAQATRTSE